jgi:hypothetical protein
VDAVAASEMQCGPFSGVREPISLTDATGVRAGQLELLQHRLLCVQANQAGQLSSQRLQQVSEWERYSTRQLLDTAARLYSPLTADRSGCSSINRSLCSRPAGPAFACCMAKRAIPA